MVDKINIIINLKNINFLYEHNIMKAICILKNSDKNTNIKGVCHLEQKNESSPTENKSYI